MGEIERYLDWLETNHGFIPDILINDYVEKMKGMSGDRSRDAINEAYIQHKRIADERNIVVITMSQVPRQSLEKSIISQRDAPAEDARKLGNVDIGLFFGQTREQEQSNRMNVWVLVGRSQKMAFGCTTVVNKAIGQLCLGCYPIKFGRMSRGE